MKSVALIVEDETKPKRKKKLWTGMTISKVYEKWALCDSFLGMFK